MKIQFQDVNISTLLGEQAGDVVIKSMEKMMQQYFEKAATKEWFSLKEGAAYAGVSYNSLIKFRTLGLKVCEIDGIKRVSKREIDRFLEENSF